MHPQLSKITAAAAGLLYMSETDAPFTPVHFSTPGTPEALLKKQAGAANDTPVEIVTLEHFFRNHTKALDNSPGATQRAAQFQQLVVALQTLAEVKVYRVGTVQVQAFILGRLPDGSWAGLATQLIET